MIKFSMLLKISVLTIVIHYQDIVWFSQVWWILLWGDISYLFKHLFSQMLFFIVENFYLWDELYGGRSFFFQMWLWSVLLLQYIYIHCVFVVCTFFALINIHCYLYTQSWADDVCWCFLWSIDVINRNRKRLNKK